MKKLTTEIKTKKGKIYGILDLYSYVLSIKEGKIIRHVPISKEGVTLIFSYNNQYEEIHIPPQYNLSKSINNL